MSMREWALEEIRRACKRENPSITIDDNGKADSWDYGTACYESAFKAYESLLNDNHSGLSFSFTRDILIRLMSEVPLTPITGEDDEWNPTHDTAALPFREYQNKRRHSLFKRVYDTGEITYSDVDYVRFYHNDIGSHFGLVSNLLHEMYPITMPYTPSTKPIKVYGTEFLTDEKNGDFDTIGLEYAILPSGERVELNKYYAEDDSGPKGWRELELAEYLHRCERKIR